MAKTIKSKLEIAGVNFKTKICDLDGLCGEVDFLDNVIYIHSGLTKEEQYSTYIHEIFHIISVKYDLDLEEHDIRLLETATVSLGIEFNKRGGKK